MQRSSTGTVVALVAAISTVTACSSGDGGSGHGGSERRSDAIVAVDAATATSAANFGGPDALVEAAQAEGQLNVIALPPDAVNYGAMMEAFTAKYGIVINSALPNGSSQDALDAVVTQDGQDRAPDVLDLGTGPAQQAAAQDLLAPYKVQPWSQIPVDQKDPEGRWYNDYGGYISIGCNARIVVKCPDDFADLLEPGYAGQVGLTGNPSDTAAAFGAIWAASLANGGSLDDIGRGIDFFAEVKKVGNFDPIAVTPATIVSGETPIAIDWEYRNAGLTDPLSAQGVEWRVRVPSDGLYGSYNSQAISKSAPHPAAARLWQEFLYSTQGQNIWLVGGVRPVLLPVMEAAGTADTTALAALPAVQGTATFPTAAQQAAAQQVIATRWNEEITG